jgi:hypothetical protein
MFSQHDDGRDPPPPTPGYTPPPSPAYVLPPAPPAITYARSAPATATGPAPPPESPAERSARLGRQLLLAGLALVGVAAAVAGVVVVTGRDPDKAYAFGEVGAASDGAIVHTGDGDDEAARPLEPGETVRAGWVVETAGEAAVTVDLAGGGIVRFDSGARLTFADLAADPRSGTPTGTSEPSIQITGGRAWVNPADEPAADQAAAVEVQIPGGLVESDGNPFALDCTSACTVEAPAGGVAVVTSAGGEAAPGANEVVTLESPDALDVAFGDAPSAWARQNLAADGKAGLPTPEADDVPGIRASAILDGHYLVTIEVVGEPAGDAIPAALQYAAGGTYAINLVADGSACDTGPCAVPVTAVDGASGTAQVTDGTVALTFSQPIDCYDEAYTVVVPGIGTTTVAATFEVGDVEHDGDRWLVRSFDGTGTVAATLITPCNPGDVLGTSASQVSIVAG